MGGNIGFWGSESGNWEIMKEGAGLGRGQLNALTERVLGPDRAAPDLRAHGPRVLDCR
jgi:hypothetical protein